MFLCLCVCVTDCIATYEVIAVGMLSSAHGSVPYSVSVCYRLDLDFLIS